MRGETTLASKKLVRVEWLDAKDADGTWVGEKEAIEFNDKEVLVESYGLLVKKTKKYITLAADRCLEDKTYGRVTKIPTRMIRSITEVPECGPSSSSSQQPSSSSTQSNVPQSLEWLKE